MGMHNEIRQQPDVFSEILRDNATPISEVVSRLRDVSFGHVVIAARGTSDNAARYAKYLWGAHNRLQVALAAPSLFTSYQSPPNLKDALVVGYPNPVNRRISWKCWRKAGGRVGRRWQSPTAPALHWRPTPTTSWTSKQAKSMRWQPPRPIRRSFLP